MLKESKIKYLTRQDSEWEAHGKKFYDYDIRFEDGTCGQCSSTDPVNPPYKVGDTVNYEEVDSNWGKKIKIRPFQNNFGGGGSRRSAGRENSITAQWAINAAISILGDTPHLPTVESTAELLIKMRDDIVTRMG